MAMGMNRVESIMTRTLLQVVLQLCLSTTLMGQVYAAEGVEGDTQNSTSEAAVSEKAITEQKATKTRHLQENRNATARELRTGQEPIHIYQLVEEIVDDVVEDIRALNTQAISPAALKSIDLSRNLSVRFGRTLESTLVAAIVRNTDLQLKRCVACRSLRSRIEKNEWVVSLGLTRQDDFAKEATRLSVKTFLNIRFDYFPTSQTVVLQAELVRAHDAAILWANTYRSNSTTAAILRSGERTLTRAERLAELERKLQERPYYGYKMYGGFTLIPYDSPTGNISGPSLGFRIFEYFGEDRRLMFGIGGDALIKLSRESPYMGALLGVIALYEVTEPDLNNLIFRTGPGVSGLLTGNQGNSVALEWAAEAVFQFRLGLGASALYVVPVEYNGADLGGVGFKVRASFNW